MTLSELALAEVERELELEGYRDDAISAMHNGEVAGELSVMGVYYVYYKHCEDTNKGYPFSGDDMPHVRTGE